MTTEVTDEVRTTRSAACLDCGECCRTLEVLVPRPQDPEGDAKAREWLAARGLRVLDDKGLIMQHYRVVIEAPCPHLAPAAPWSCDIYETRPAVCREYDGRGVESVDCKWEV